MNPDMMIKKEQAAKFIETNGKILRGLNMLSIGYKRLSSIRTALCIDSDDFAESVNYLIDEGYVKIRHCDTKKDIELVDYPMDEIEGKITPKGTRLLLGTIKDDCITV